MGDSENYVVYGMRAKCSQGSMENYLSTDRGHGVTYQGQPVLNANDHQKGINLTHFGDCHAKALYEEAKKQIDEKYKADEGDGFFKKAGKWLLKTAAKTAVSAKEYLMFNKCELDTPLPWVFTNKEHMVDGAPALTMESQCACRFGGVITIVPAPKEEAPEETTIEDEIMQKLKQFQQFQKEVIDYLTMPLKFPLIKMHEKFLELWGTELGNKIEKDLFNMVKPIVTPVFAFQYNEQEDYYNTTETYGVQRRFGFMDLYDDLSGLLGMDLETEILVFTPDGSDKEYRLQFWRGSYCSGGAYGGEIGLYQRSSAEAEKMPYSDENPLKKFIYYECVSGEDEIRTKQEFFSAYDGTPLIMNDTKDYAVEGDHFWNLAIKTDQGFHAEDLVVIETLTIKDKNMKDKIIEEIKKNDNLTLREDLMEGDDIVVQFGEYKD